MVLYEMETGLGIWIQPVCVVQCCAVVGVCGGEEEAWEWIGCKWLRAFLHQQEGEQAPWAKIHQALLSQFSLLVEFFIGKVTVRG